MAGEVGVAMFLFLENTKVIVIDAFKDVHARLGTFGPPLHCNMKHNVTSMQAHSRRCSVAKKQRHLTQWVVLKNRMSWKRLLSWLHGSPTVSIERTLTEAYLCVSILTKQSIKPLKFQSTAHLQLMSYCQSWQSQKNFLCGCVQRAHKHWVRPVKVNNLNHHAYSDWPLLLVAFSVRGQSKTGGIPAYTA